MPATLQRALYPGTLDYKLAAVAPFDLQASNPVEAKPWTFLALAGVWILLWLWMLHGGVFGLEKTGVEQAIEVFRRNPLGQLAFMGIPVIMFYSFGRAIRYVLSGE